MSLSQCRGCKATESRETPPVRDSTPARAGARHSQLRAQRTEIVAPPDLCSKTGETEPLPTTLPYRCQHLQRWGDRPTRELAVFRRYRNSEVARRPAVWEPWKISRHAVSH